VVYYSSGVTEGSCLVTGTADPYGSKYISVYPSPTNGEVRWSGNKNWILLNSQGIEINRGTGASANLSHYPAGIYILKLNENTFQIVKE
jgi:hypothetical protein